MGKCGGRISAYSINKHGCIANGHQAIITKDFCLCAGLGSTQRELPVYLAGCYPKDNVVNIIILIVPLVGVEAVRERLASTQESGKSGSLCPARRK